MSGVSYRAVEVGGTVVNQLPPPGTGTFYSTVTPLLIPQGSAAPAMLLVTVVKGTVAPDGTVSNEVVQTYLPGLPPARRGPGRLEVLQADLAADGRPPLCCGWLRVGPGTRRPRRGRSLLGLGGWEARALPADLIGQAGGTQGDQLAPMRGCGRW